MAQLIKLVLSMLTLLAALSAEAQSPDRAAAQQHYFPLLIDGGGYQTFFYVTNVSDVVNECNIYLGMSGLDADMFEANHAVTLSGGRLFINLAVDADIVLASTNRQRQTVGNAHLYCDKPVVARVIITSKASGAITAMTTVEPVDDTRKFLLPVLTPYSRSMALVLANYSFAWEIFCAVELENEAGESIGGDSVTLPVNVTNIRFLDEIVQIPEDFESGIVKVTCDKEAGILGLIDDGSVFAAVPPFELSGLHSRDKFSHIHAFPIVADGGGFRSRLFVIGDVISMWKVHCAFNPQRTGTGLNRFDFFGDIRASGADAILYVFNPPKAGSITQLSSTGDQELEFGYVTIGCSPEALSGHLLTYGESGQTAGSTVFPGAPIETDFRFPLIPRLGDSGLIFANYWETESSCEFTVRNNRQSILGEGSFKVPKRSTTVQFLGNLTPVPANFSGGSARVSCDRRVAGMGLAISGPVFTSLPPVVLPPANPEPDSRPELIRTITSVPKFTIGEPVSFPMEEVEGGNPPLVFSLAPPIPGLVFDQETRLLTGVPSEAGVYRVDYDVRDVDGDFAGRNFDIIVAEPDTAPSLAHASELEDQVYDRDTAVESLQLPEAAEGNHPLHYRLTPDIPGLSFDAESRQLSGTPTTTGVYHMTYSVTDDDGDTDSLNFRIWVLVPITPADLIDADGCDNGRYTNGRGGNSGLAEDCRVLVAVANALIETGLNTEDNPIRQWGRGDQVEMSLWDGIEISGSRVTVITLNRRQLKGSIPSEIGGLSELTSLDLSGASPFGFAGAIPGLTGEIPPELANLKNLRFLNLEWNQLTGGIPSELKSLGQLETLRLGGNNLTGTIPAELGELSNLQILSLWRNEISGAIPAELGSLQNLQILLLWNNQLEGTIPETLLGLRRLRNFDLSRNRLSGDFPEWLGQLSNLQKLDIGSNRFSGKVPPSLGQLSNLTDLKFDNNQLTGAIPREFGRLSKLQQLLVDNNELEGSLPPELGSLQNLRTFWGQNNHFSGPIPPEFGNMRNLEQLLLNDNRLTGSIPKELAELPNLRNLILSGNRLSGPLPWAFGDFRTKENVRFLFDGNLISGLLPPPARERLPTYSSNPEANGNAAHHSIAYFQGPLLFEWDWEGEQIVHHTPILGRWAGLAVRVDHAVEEPPRVITRVLNDEDEVLAESLEEAAPPLTEEIGPGRWRSEYIFYLPGSLFQAGNQLIHVIDPDDELAETDETDNVSEALVLNGEQPPNLRLTFIPIQHPEREVWHEDLDVEELMSGVRAFLPVADNFDARIGPAFETETDSMFNMLLRLLGLWNRDAEPDEFYHGLVDRSGGGVAFEPGQVAVSAISLHRVIPHELGHNLSLGHAPGCSAGLVDENYPHPNGQLGPGLGWELNWRRFVSGEDQAFTDLMSYCGATKFISGYNYGKASEYWLSFEPGSGAGISTGTSVAEAPVEISPTADSDGGTGGISTQAASTSDATGSLALSGGISAEGVWSLGQAQLSERGPRPPAEDGEFTLVLFDSAGVQVYDEPLAVIQISEGEESFWAARTPLPLRTAAEIVILDPQGNEVLRQALPELE